MIITNKMLWNVFLIFTIIVINQFASAQKNSNSKFQIPKVRKPIDETKYSTLLLNCSKSELKSPLTNDEHTIQLCLNGSTLSTLEIHNLTQVDQVTWDSSRISHVDDALSLTLQDVNDIEINWYQVSKKVAKSFSISKIIFINVDRLRVLRGLIDELPDYMKAITIERSTFQHLTERSLSNEFTLNLKISETKLYDIANRAIDMPNLEELSLIMDGIGSTKFIATLPKRLKSLNLLGNELVTIPTKTFDNLRYLEYLVLAANAIVNIEPRAFDNLHRLKHLDLSLNDITEIGVFVGLESVTTLNLQFNPMESNDERLGLPKNCSIIYDVDHENFS